MHGSHQSYFSLQTSPNYLDSHDLLYNDIVYQCCVYIDIQHHTTSSSMYASMSTMIYHDYLRYDHGMLSSKPCGGCLGVRCGDASWAPSATTGVRQLSASGGAELRPVDAAAR